MGRKDCWPTDLQRLTLGSSRGGGLALRTSIWPKKKRSYGHLLLLSFKSLVFFSLFPFFFFPFSKFQLSWEKRLLSCPKALWRR